jgi:hypothetical protein
MTTQIDVENFELTSKNIFLIFYGSINKKEFNEYGIPESTFKKCNHCSLLFKGPFKILQTIWK